MTDPPGLWRPSDPRLLQCRAMACPRCNCKDPIVCESLCFFPWSRSRSRDATREMVVPVAAFSPPPNPPGGYQSSEVHPRRELVVVTGLPKIRCTSSKTAHKIRCTSSNTFENHCEKNNGPFSRKTQQVFCRKKCN